MSTNETPTTLDPIEDEPTEARSGGDGDLATPADSPESQPGREGANSSDKGLHAPLGMGANSLDIFSDPSKLLLSASFAITTEKVVLQIPVKRPNKQDFFRIHSDRANWPRVLLLTDEATREVFLVSPTLHHAVANLAMPFVLYPYLTRAGDLGLWPVRSPGPDGRSNDWWDSAHAAAEYAVDHWIRLESGPGRYVPYRAVNEGGFPEPIWPKNALSDLLRLGFEHRLIQSGDHALLKKLRGEI